MRLLFGELAYAGYDSLAEAQLEPLRATDRVDSLANARRNVTPQSRRRCVKPWHSQNAEILRPDTGGNERRPALLAAVNGDPAVPPIRRTDDMTVGDDQIGCDRHTGPDSERCGLGHVSLDRNHEHRGFNPSEDLLGARGATTGPHGKDQQPRCACGRSARRSAQGECGSYTDHVPIVGPLRTLGIPRRVESRWCAGRSGRRNPRAHDARQAHRRRTPWGITSATPKPGGHSSSTSLPSKAMERPCLLTLGSTRTASSAYRTKASTSSSRAPFRMTVDPSPVTSPP